MYSRASEELLLKRVNFNMFHIWDEMLEAAEFESEFHKAGLQLNEM
jgi:hypothetical protein